jgi:hypothetical protein
METVIPHHQNSPYCFTHLRKNALFIHEKSVLSGPDENKE